MTNIDLDRPNPVASADRPASTGAGWTRAGLVGGVAGLAALMVSSSLVPKAAMNDNTKLVAQITDKRAIVWISQVLFVVAAAGLVIFAAGLRRHLRHREPIDSLLPTIAYTGAVMTAAAALIGGGTSTELFW